MPRVVGQLQTFAKTHPSTPGLPWSGAKGQPWVARTASTRAAVRVVRSSSEVTYGGIV